MVINPNALWELISYGIGKLSYVVIITSQVLIQYIYFIRRLTSLLARLNISIDG
jgi:hypothetical protein